MIQLVFDADTPAQALSGSPSRSATASTTGGERATLGDDKLEVVDGTHPVVHPAAGSHANFYGASPLPRQLGRRGRRLRRHARAVRSTSTRSSRRSPAMPPRPGAGPVDRLRGALGRAASGVLQRAGGPEPEAAVDEPDRLVRELARPCLHGSRRRRLRPCGHGLLLHRGRRRLAARSSSSWPGRSSSRSMLAGLVLLAIVLLSRTTWRPAAPLPVAHRRAWGADRLGLDAHVRQTLPAVHRHGRAVRADLAARDAAADAARARHERARRAGRRVEQRRARLPRARDRDGADAARARPRAGRQPRGRSSSSTRDGRSGRSPPTGWPRTACGRCSARCSWPSRWSPCWRARCS